MFWDERCLTWLHLFTSLQSDGGSRSSILTIRLLFVTHKQWVRFTLEYCLFISSCIIKDWFQVCASFYRLHTQAKLPIYMTSVGWSWARWSKSLIGKTVTVSTFCLSCLNAKCFALYWMPNEPDKINHIGERVQEAKVHSLFVTMFSTSPWSQHLDTAWQTGRHHKVTAVSHRHQTSRGRWQSRFPLQTWGRCRWCRGF